MPGMLLARRAPAEMLSLVCCRLVQASPRVAKAVSKAVGSGGTLELTQAPNHPCCAWL